MRGNMQHAFASDEYLSMSMGYELMAVYIPFWHSLHNKLSITCQLYPKSYESSRRIECTQMNAIIGLCTVHGVHLCTPVPKHCNVVLACVSRNNYNLTQRT